MLLRTSRRYLQTVRPSPAATMTPMYGSLPSSTTAASAEKWARHGLPDFSESKNSNNKQKKDTGKREAMPRARARPFTVSQSMAKPTAATSKQQQATPSSASTMTPEKEKELKSHPLPSEEKPAASGKLASEASGEKTAAKPKRKLRPRKAAITLSPKAVEHLRGLLDSPDPKLIRVGVKNRGCSGLTYHLEYVDEPGKFDEEISQDGVKVLIDSKALFSIIGSEMDWIDDKLSSRFIFNNPNSKGQCGCGESFMV